MHSPVHFMTACTPECIQDWEEEEAKEKAEAVARQLLENERREKELEEERAFLQRQKVREMEMKSQDACAEEKLSAGEMLSQYDPDHLPRAKEAGKEADAESVQSDDIEMEELVAARKAAEEAGVAPGNIWFSCTGQRCGLQ